MPTLDRARFRALLHRLSTGADPSALFEDLSRAWSEPHRAYHGPAHLASCLALLDATRASAVRADEIEAALWFHDAVYDPRADDSEVRSAAWAAVALSEIGAASDAVPRIEALVLVTRHDREPQDADQRLIGDIDLAVLGAVPEEFDRYDRAIRMEYAWVPADRYRRERGAVLRGLLEREPLYRTVPFRARETSARANITRALERLQAAPRANRS